jgi:Uma2 family endonuclease
MGAFLSPITRDEFLAWEAEQEERFEFDGIQPVAMTGGTRAHARLVTRLIVGLSARLLAGCETFAGDLKVLSTTAIRYPDVTVTCDPGSPTDTEVRPTAVFEVLSRSTALTDLRVKPVEYAAMPSVQVYVILEQDRPRALVLRRSHGWLEEVVAGRQAVIALPEIGVELPLSDIYAGLDASGTPLADT